MEKTDRKKQMQKKGKKKTGKRVGKRMRIALIVIAVLILMLCVFLGKFALNGASAEAALQVPKGCTPQMLNDTIEKYLGKDYAEDVDFLLGMLPVDVATKDGMYIVPEGTSALKLAWRIARHRQSEIRLTIRHLRTLDDLANLIAANSTNTPAEVKKALLDPEFLKQHGVTAEQVRVLFMENTYNLFYGWDAKQVRDKVVKEYDKFWNDTRREKAKKLGLTPEEVMIIASIADEESNFSDEKGAIGRLYINRLNKNMKLQADPTTKYAVGDFSIRRITGKHTSIDNPYNTYKYAGLPPGPIRTTSQKTVDEILDSKPSDYIFMCAKEDFSGYHNFATTYEEHKKNADRYQAELDKRDIH